jgi:hypothetical protein
VKNTHLYSLPVSSFLSTGKQRHQLKTGPWEPGPVGTWRSQTNNLPQSVIFYSGCKHFFPLPSTTMTIDDSLVKGLWPWAGHVSSPVWSALSPPASVVASLCWGALVLSQIAQQPLRRARLVLWAWQRKGYE